MSDIPGLSLPVGGLTAQTNSTAQLGTSTADAAKKGKIKETAEAFEASFLSIMISQMFEGLDTDGPFGGGDGEKMFRSYFSDAIAKQVAHGGRGIGLSAQVSKEMLKLQGMQ